MNTVREIKPFTAEELFQLPGDARYELIEGELHEMAPPGGEHAGATQLLSSYATVYADTHGLGLGLAEVGFLVSRNPDTVLAPDFAFISASKVPKRLPKDYLTIVPDIVLETRSPGDTRREVAAKVERWLHFGVRLVWTAEPQAKVFTVYRFDHTVTILKSGDTLNGEDVLPGFLFPLSKLFS